LPVFATRSLKLYLMGSAFLQCAAFVLTLVWLYLTRTIDLRGIANSLIPPAFSVTTSFLGLELVRGVLTIRLEAPGGAAAYAVSFCILYAFQLRMISAQQCREVVRFLPGSSYLQRWLVLGV
jgi:hypothetical protein